MLSLNRLRFDRWFPERNTMSNKPHLRPHQKKRQASRVTSLLVAILVIAFLALAIALEATGHIVFRGRLILLIKQGRVEPADCRPGYIDQLQTGPR